MTFSPSRPLRPASVLLLALLLPTASLFAPPTPTPTPTPVPTPTPRPTHRPTPTPTPGPPQKAIRFEVSSSEIGREPFSLVGRVESNLGAEDKVATGAVAARRLVLSAAEVLWNEEDGFATRVIFQRGQLGADVLQRTRATFIVLLNSYTKADDERDRINSNVGALLFRTAPGQGRALDLQPTRDYLTTDHRNFMLGYFSTIGGGKRMGGLSEISFRKADGKLLFLPQNVDSFPSFSLGAPVFHGLSVGSVFRPILVGIVVSGGAVRGFSPGQVRDFQAAQ